MLDARGLRTTLLQLAMVALGLASLAGTIVSIYLAGLTIDRVLKPAVAAL